MIFKRGKGGAEMQIKLSNGQRMKPFLPGAGGKGGEGLNICGGGGRGAGKEGVDV